MSKYVQLRDSKTGEPIFPVTGSTDITPITDEEIDTICDFDSDPEGDVIPIATDTVLGCVKVGDGLSVDAAGKVDSLGIQMELLWENANPTSNFVSQTISLDLSKYKYVDVFCHFRVSTNQHGGWFRFEKVAGHEHAMTMLDYLRTTSADVAYIYRNIQVADNFINVGNGAYHVAQGVATNDAFMIPIKIYGIKGVQ